MKDIDIDIIKIILGLAYIVGVVIGVAKCSNNQDYAEWNNGFCECGGHWVYEQAVGHQTRTSYIYRCDECGETIEIWNINVTEGGAE